MDDLGGKLKLILGLIIGIFIAKHVIVFVFELASGLLGIVGSILAGILSIVLFLGGIILVALLAYIGALILVGIFMLILNFLGL